jgi:hypothetical protein
MVEQYAAVLRDPAVSVVLKQFEERHFVAAGEAFKPGKDGLHGGLVTQGARIRGRHDEVRDVLDRVPENRRQDDGGTMLGSRDLSADRLLKPRDTLFVPQSTLSQIAPFIPTPSIALYLDGLSWAR